MDSHIETTMNTLQAFNLSSQSDEKVDVPVLDLSCKNRNFEEKANLDSSICTSTYSESNLHSPIRNTNQETNDTYIQENQNSFEARALMITPPSESSSPKKRKYKRIFNRLPGDMTKLPVQTIPIMLPVLSTIRRNTSKKPDQQLPPPIQRNVESPTLSSESSSKVLRPFKAYPKDPMSLSMGAAEIMYDQSSFEAYAKFRERMLESVRKTNEGPNIRMRRMSRSLSSPTSTVDEKNAAYLERRKKNNEAAKRSRDARRAKEDEIAIRAAFLEQENLQLKCEIVALREETAKLRAGDKDSREPF